MPRRDIALRSFAAPSALSLGRWRPGRSAWRLETPPGPSVSSQSPPASELGAKTRPVRHSLRTSVVYTAGVPPGRSLIFAIQAFVQLEKRDKKIEKMPSVVMGRVRPVDEVAVQDNWWQLNGHASDWTGLDKTGHTRTHAHARSHHSDARAAPSSQSTPGAWIEATQGKTGPAVPQTPLPQPRRSTAGPAASPRKAWTLPVPAVAPAELVSREPTPGHYGFRSSIENPTTAHLTSPGFPGAFDAVQPLDAVIGT